MDLDMIQITVYNNPGATNNQSRVQCPLDIATLDIAAALPIATSTPVTNLRQYINSDLGYNDLKF